MSAAALRLARLILNDPDRARSEAQRIETAATKKRQRVLAKSRPRRKAEKVENLSEQARHLELVQDVFARDGFLCELGGHHCVSSPVDPHHLEGGNGKRRSEEKISNLIRACRFCHDEYHKRPQAYVERVKTWCAQHGYPLPRRREYR